MRTNKLFNLIASTAAVAALAVPAAASAAPHATKLEKVSSVAQPGILYLETTYEGYVKSGNGYWLNGGKPLSVTASCSGFFVNPDGHFVTAGHCVDRGEGRSLLIKKALTELNDGVEPPLPVLQTALRTFRVKSAATPAKDGADREVRAAYGVDYGGMRAGKPLPARVEGLRPFLKGDVALLKIEAEDVPVLELAPKDAVEIGTQVVSVGYPGSVDFATDLTFDPSFKEGAVSSQKTIEGGLVSATEVSAPLSGGMSGGPTVDLKGRVVGVNSFGITGEPQPFNFISPVSEVANLLADEGVDNELGPITTTYRSGVDAYYAGDREAALAKFDDVLGQVSEHEFAQKFRAQALRMPEPNVEQGGGFPIALLAGLVALMLAAAAATALYLRRRGQGGDSRPTAPQSPRSPRGTAAQTDGRGHAVMRSNGGPALVTSDGERIEIASELTMGRGEVDVPVDDREVSRRHAKVEPTGAGLVLSDLDSANGTKVNGQRIDRPMLLVDGDEVTIGKTTMRVELVAAAGWRDRATVMHRERTAPRAVA